MANTKDTCAEDETQSVPRSHIEWDDSKMATTYANVANAASMREEIALIFGTSRTRTVSNDQLVRVDLVNRIILSPDTARQFMLLLKDVLYEYDSHFGELDVEST